MSQNPATLYPCPCCGYLTLLEKPPDTYLVCPICFWEDTGEHSRLLIAQRNFVELGACDAAWLAQVRRPTEQDQRIPNWQPLHVLAEAARPKVIAQITSAFEDVVRSDGVSLHEARVIDDWGGMEERMVARKMDTDKRWQDVPWEWIEKLHDALAFLDPKGWRYYIPAYMLYSLNNYITSRSNAVYSAIYSLLLHEDTKKRKGLKEHQLSYFRVLTTEQSKAVCQFLRFMVVYDNWDGYGGTAQEALNRYWDKFCLE